MRPLPGRDSTPGNAGSGDDTTSSFVTVNTPSPMSFVFADDSAMDGSTSPEFPPTISPHPCRSRKEPGIRLPCTPSSSSRDNTSTKPRPPMSAPLSPTQSPPTPQTPIDDFSAAMKQATGLALPALSGPISAISSQSSRRGSLSCSISEDQQSYTFSALEGSVADFLPLSPDYDEHVESQLIMPTLAVPTRRPFTEQGKALGRLKLLVAGDSGIGKTSLVNAIVQTCEHITHVDPATIINHRAGSNPSAVNVLGGRPANRTSSTISEMLASTKPYPSWWNLADEVGLSPRRQSLGDSVLDRNICFVDTPGYKPTPDRVVDEVSQYIDQHLRKSMMSGLDESDVLTTISNGGGVLVDAVIYMIPGSGLSFHDLYFLRQLESKTSIIPVVAHADTMSPTEVIQAKELVLEQLAEANIAPFSFHQSIPAAKDISTVFAVSSISGSDQDNMDASLLMSPDYMPPLIPTDLATLVEEVFSADGSSRLRHATAKKLLRWRQRHDSNASSQTASAIAGIVTAPMDGRMVPAFSRRPSNQTQERWAQVRLVNWASDLQRSLIREREACEHLLYEQRAAWLRSQLGDRADRRTALALTSRRRRSCDQTKSLRRSSISPDVDVRPQDPLGLIQFGLQMRWTGWLALELAGSASVVGGLALWVFSS